MDKDLEEKFKRVLEAEAIQLNDSNEIIGLFYKDRESALKACIITLQNKNKELEQENFILKRDLKRAGEKKQDENFAVCELWDLYDNAVSELQLAEKALELLKDKNNYYKFVNENTETINVDLAIKEAKG